MLCWKVKARLTKGPQAVALLDKFQQFAARIRRIDDGYECLIPCGRKPDSVRRALSTFDSTIEFELVDLYLIEGPLPDPAPSTWGRA